MADEISMALDELVRKAQLSEDIDFLREGVRALAQALMEAGVTQQVGASRYERTPKRRGERNGSRERRWDTRVGSITLRVPLVRDGSYFPSLLEPRRRAERALVAVVQEASVHGVSTRRVDELARQGGEGAVALCGAGWDTRGSGVGPHDRLDRGLGRLLQLAKIRGLRPEPCRAEEGGERAAGGGLGHFGRVERGDASCGSATDP